MVGPIPMLGHSDPENAAPPCCPPPLSALFLITASDHESISRSIAQQPSREWKLPMAPQKFLMKIHAAAKEGDVMEMLSLCMHLPEPAEDLPIVADRLKSKTLPDRKNLPVGWFEALARLSTNTPVVRPDLFPSTPQSAGLLTPLFATKHSLVPFAADSTTIWAAAKYAGSSPEGRQIATRWRSTHPSDLPAELRLVLAPASLVDDRIALQRRKYNPLFALPKPDQLPASSDGLMQNEIPELFRISTEEFPIGFSPRAPGVAASDLLKWALAAAVIHNASDIHFQMTRGFGIVRLRIDGELRPLLTSLQPEVYGSILGVIRNAARMAGRPGTGEDANISASVDGKFYELRISLLPQVSSHGAIVMRLLPKEGAAPSLAALSLSEKHMSQFRGMFTSASGIILVTGPTGSGKTTTIAAALAELDLPDVKILTVEDPPEIRIPGAVVTAVGPHFTFADALKYFLRHDPDTILVGEIRDQETAHLAFSASKTGHIVFATLHTNSAPDTIQRLADLGVPAIDLALCNGIIAQRLVRRLCHCKIPHNPTDEELQWFERVELGRPSSIYGPKGCPECNHSGYAGRLPILEIISGTESLRKALKAGIPMDQLEQVIRADGYRPFWAQGLEKVLAGDTSFTEVLPHLPQL
jgi:type II secretory ATPase GspE/PulE/Tfp pilus assembly ATPase PilB-like protein